MKTKKIILLAAGLLFAGNLICAVGAPVASGGAVPGVPQTAPSSSGTRSVQPAIHNGNQNMTGNRINRNGNNGVNGNGMNGNNGINTIPNANNRQPGISPQMTNSQSLRGQNIRTQNLSGQTFARTNFYRRSTNYYRPYTNRFRPFTNRFQPFTNRFQPFTNRPGMIPPR